MPTKSLLTFTTNRFIFSPKLLPTIVTLLLLPLLISLGFWQLQRADYKRTLLEQFTQQVKAKPMQLIDSQQAANISEKQQYYPIQLSGFYDNQHNFLLDNKIYQHKIGYQVITPFIPEGMQNAILINRGWIPRGADRRILPVIPALESKQTIQGMIFFPSGKTFLLSKVIGTEDWPRVIQAIDTGQMSSWIGRPVYPWLVLQNKEANDKNELARDWNPVTASPTKNIAYAVQWFSLAATLLIIFIVVNTKKKSSRVL